MKRLKTLLVLMAVMLPFVANTQVYIGDYTFLSYTSTYSSIASTGTELTGLVADDATQQVVLPFVLQFGQDTTSSIMVTTNGQIGIGNVDPATNGYMDHTNDMSIIVPFGQDLSLDTSSGGGHVYYQAMGSSPNQVMVIEYDHVQPYHSSGSSTNTYSFQVWLYESGDIEFVYDTCSISSSATGYVFIREHAVNSACFVTGNWSNLSVGRAAGTIAMQNNNKPVPGLTLSFTRPFNTCPRPFNFVCQSFSRPDSVVFAWNTDPSTAAWELRYDTVGTPVDSMMNVITSISDSFYVCTTMVAGGVYEAYLRTDCGGEQSFWEGPVLVTPGSYNMPATGYNTIYACGGTIYDDGGSTGNYSNDCNSILVINPSHPDSLVVISGTLSTESCCDHLYIHDGVGTSGPLLYQGQGLNQTVPSIRSNSGPLTIQFTSDISVVNSGFALNVSCVRAPLCRTIADVEVTNIAGSSALLSWSLIGNTTMPSGFVVTLVNNSDPTAAPVTDFTTDPYYFFSGLAEMTSYTANVRSICGTDTIEGDTVSFSTRCLVGGTTNPSGTGTLQTSGIPVYSGWGNSFCQSIYTAAELTAMGLTAGPINGVTYTWSTAGSYDKEIVIFMGQTSNSTFSSYAPLTGSMTQVYSGPRTTADVGTIEYYFTTPFVWDGVSNIVLSSFINQPAGASHVSSGFYGYSTSCGYTRSIYSYKDGTAFTMSNLNTYSNSSTSTSRPNVQFIKPCDTTATCVAPNVVVTEVLDDRISIMWAPGYGETSWNLYYKAADDTAWTSEATGVTTTSYIFTSLTPMTEYILRVDPACSDGSVHAHVTVTTPCVPLTTLPFTENFENFTASSTAGSPITSCWNRGTNSTSAYPYRSTSYANSGSASMYFYASGTTYYSYLALPAIDVEMDTLQVSFAALHTSASYNVQVGVMTDPEDYTTFTQVATITPSALTTWEMFEVPLRNYTGNGKYIAFFCGGATSFIYLDDIEVDYIPTCQRPYDVAATRTTTTTATLHWSDPGVNFFEIEYGPAGFTRGTGTVVTSSADSVTLYGLNHSSRYEVYVRAICSLTDTSNWSFPTYFYTDCDKINSLPYTATFGGWGVGTGARPVCWACGGYSNYPYIVNVTDALNNIIGQTFYFYSYGSNTVYASLPELDSISYPVETTQAVFKAWTNNTTSTLYSHKFIVGVCSSQGDMSTFTPIDTVELTPTPALYEVAFNNAVGAGKYITFVSTALDGASYNYAYLDSVSVELIPDCQSPNHLLATAVTSNSATVTWNERNISLSWQVEYGPHGFVPGTGARIVTSNNPHTITGLNPSTSYDFYVRSICGPADTSLWSHVPGMFNTLQNPATIPYFYDFETSAEWDNWQTNSNTTINWYRDTAAGNGTPGLNVTGYYSMYISVDTGRTFSTDYNRVVNATAYRDIDFGPVDSSYLLTFRAAAGGTPSIGYDGLMVFLVDPAVPVVASNSNITTPWGMVNDLSPLAVIRTSNNWNTYSIVIDTIYGVHRLAFFWFNQSTASTYHFEMPACVDDIRIDYVDCPRPAGVRATHVTMASADVTWHGPAVADYRVICRNATGGIVSSELVHSNQIHYSGLTPGSRYNVFVRRLCSSTDSSGLSTSGTFYTKFCNDGIIDTIASSSYTTSYQMPLSNYYNYSYTQQIIGSSELGGSGEINAISFYYSGTSAMTAKTACTIYMAHTTLSSFASSDNFVDPADMQIVYTGNLNCSPGWNRILLSYPFTYNGSSNLVIAVDDNSGSYQGTGYTFNVDQTSGLSSILLYSDSENPNPTSLATLSAFNGTRTALAYRNQLIIEKCPPNSCPPPILRNPIIRTTGVTLRWRNTGVSYQIGYRLATSSSWITDNYTVNDTFYTIHNLYPMTDYVFHVRQYCDSTGVSNWSTGSFNSSDVPCLAPMNLHVTTVTNKKATLYWSPEENNLSYRLHVFNTAFDKVVNCYVAHGTVTGLEANIVYYAAVQAVCQGFDDPSEWSDTIMFTSDVCPDVTNLTTSDLQGNSVVLDWTEGGRAERWEIQYGYIGFPQGSGFSVIADTHPYRLTGLIGETDYDIYVRAICEDDFVSEHWSNKVTITTPYSSIASVSDDARIQITPNPTSADVKLTIPPCGSAVKVEVIDLTGRVRISQMLTPGTETTMLPTSQLTQGAYFVRVTGDDINMARKLIVR